MRLILDRFEGEYVVCEKEDKTMFDVPLKDIPKNAKEGDILVTCEGTIVVDRDETSKRKEEIKNLMDKLWNN